jgi:hypothetical protein
VWITPLEDADIYIDYNNTGSNYEVRNSTKALASVRIWDKVDHDMSGAVIFATKKGTGTDGPEVSNSFAAILGIGSSTVSY